MGTGEDGISRTPIPRPHLAMDGRHRSCRNPYARDLGVGPLKRIRALAVTPRALDHYPDLWEETLTGCRKTGGGPTELDRNRGALSEALLGSR